MKSKLLAICLTLIVLMQSCMATKTPVGEYKQQQGEEKKYAKAKQLFLFGVRMGKTTVATPSDGNCMIKEKYTFGDILLYSLTAGIVTSRTIVVYTKVQKE